MKTKLLENADDLADTKAPGNLSKEKTARLEKIIDRASVGSFDLIIYISAALAFLGSLTAAFMVKKGILSG